MKRLISSAFLILGIAALAPSARATRAISTVSVGAETAPVTAGTTATYTSFATSWTGITGTCTPIVTFNFTLGTPTGVTEAFNPTPLTNSNNNPDLNIATTALTPAGTYSFTVTVASTGGSGSCATGSVTSAAATLIVLAPPRGQIAEQTSANCTTASGATCTISLNLSAITSGNNVLLVGISSAASSVANEEVASGVTWNGTAMTIVPSCTITEGPSGDNTAHVEIWSMANPTLTSSTVVVTFPATHAQTIFAGAALFSNVASIGTCQTFTGLVTNPGTVSKTVTVATGGGAFDALGVDTGSSSVVTIGAGQTSAYNASSGEAAGAGTYELNSTGSVTMSESWSNGSNALWAYAVVPLNPVVVHNGQVVIGSLFRDAKPALVSSARLRTNGNRDTENEVILPRREEEQPLSDGAV